jgi:hypothetical protein
VICCVSGGRTTVDNRRVGGKALAISGKVKGSNTKVKGTNR